MIVGIPMSKASTAIGVTGSDSLGEMMSRSTFASMNSRI